MDGQTNLHGRRNMMCENRLLRCRKFAWLGGEPHTFSASSVPYFFVAGSLFQSCPDASCSWLPKWWERPAFVAAT